MMIVLGLDLCFRRPDWPPKLSGECFGSPNKSIADGWATRRTIAERCRTLKLSLDQPECPIFNLNSRSSKFKTKSARLNEKNALKIEEVAWQSYRLYIN